MGIAYSCTDPTDPNCVVVLTDDVNPERTATVGPNASLAEQEAAIVAFFATPDED